MLLTSLMTSTSALCAHTTPSALLPRVFNFANSARVRGSSASQPSVPLR